MLQFYAPIKILYRLFQALNVAVNSRLNYLYKTNPMYFCSVESVQVLYVIQEIKYKIGFIDPNLLKTCNYL